MNNTGCIFSIRSNLSTKNGLQSVLLNHALEVLWVRPKGKEDAYEEMSELFVIFTPMGSKRPSFTKSIFQRSRNGKRTCVSFVKDKGGFDRYIATKLVHKFSKKENTPKTNDESPSINILDIVEKKKLPKFPTPPANMNKDDWNTLKELFENVD